MNSLMIFLATSGEIDISPIKDWVLKCIAPWIGIFSFIAAIGVVAYIAFFWIGWLFADEEEKEEKPAKFRKRIKMLVIVFAISVSLGTLLVAVGAVVGLDLSGATIG